MRKSLSYKILTALLMLNSINFITPPNTFAVDVTVDHNIVTSHGNAVLATDTDFQGQTYTGTNKDGNNITVSNSTLNSFKGSYLNASGVNNISNYKITIENSTINGEVNGIHHRTGGSTSSANNIELNIIDTTVMGNVIGANIDQYLNFNNIQSGFTVSLEGSNERATTVGGDVIVLQRSSQHYVYGFSAKNCYLNIKNNVDISRSNLYAYKDNNPDTPINFSGDAVLTLDNWSGSVLGAYNFSDIDFNNINWVNGGTVLNITQNGEVGALANTNINLNSLNFAGGTQLNTGDTMTFVNGENLGIGTGTGKVTVAPEFAAGVATVGTGTAVVDENSVKYTLTEVKQNSQVNLVVENRAVAAAFVNQGTDLISDSLDVLSRDSNYGVKTFAAVQGNKSKYDVNSDIKINGWSTIVGVGNADKFDSGSEFSWGVFYENGSGNYRTYNEFNNEFFRGDGSLVYNGGGIAARYKNKNGVYTEGSLRAGMLKSDMDNALRDGTGNTYGYESESAYYGAHIGVGKIISLSESSDLDIYGKFFHTYVEGDSFNVAGDNFDFDSINSDRLRVGARVTTNKENKFSTYYGLAYEYEFNGDADMKAAGISAPTQSLQGSSYMAELGLNYQPTPTSPWSFDLNLRGYTGERQGGSFNVQATYTF